MRSRGGGGRDREIQPAYVPFRSHGMLIGAVYFFCSFCKVQMQATFDLSTQVEMCSKKFIVIVDDSKLCDEGALSDLVEGISRIFVHTCFKSF